MGLAWSVGQKLTATRMNNRQPITVVKPTLTARTSTTTMAADPHFVFDLKAGFTYSIRGFLVHNSASGTPNMKCEWHWTNTATFNRALTPAGGAIASGAATTSWYGYNGDSSSPSASMVIITTSYATHTLIEESIAVGSSADSTLTLYWAQNTSSADYTRILDGSTISAIPVL